MLVPINRTRWSEWVLSQRVRTGMLVGLLSGLIAGCIPLPATVKVAQSGDLPTPSGAIALSVFSSPDFSPGTSMSLSEDMVECITRDLAKAAPEARLVSEEEFHHALFGLKPGEVLLQAETIGTLLARPDVRQRARESGFTHLILVEGVTTQDFEGGAFAYIALVDSRRSTRLTASIFELANGRAVWTEASAEGSQGFFSVAVILSLGWFTMTESTACDALGAEVARIFNGRLPDESR